MKPEIGILVPEFELPAIDWRGAQTTVSAQSLRGKPFVLFVYPRDNTPGCTVESCQFRDLWQEFREIGVEIVGVSRDSIRSHGNFIKKSELPFLLLSDEKRELIGAWGLIINAQMYGKDVTKTARMTYFVDATGVVREIWEDVVPLGHARAVLDFCRDFVQRFAA